jgi:hypothetical protein
MKVTDITKHIQKYLPNHTNLFTGQVQITSITTAGNIATATLSQAVTLNTGAFVSITGVRPLIDISSITRQDNIVTVQTATDNLLPPIDNRPNSLSKNQYQNKITIQGATPNEYNGTWEVYTSQNANTFTFKIKTTPATPATVNGSLLFDDYENNYNGIKQITVINSTRFTFPVSYPFAVGGNMFLNVTRVAGALSLDNIARNYEKSENDITEPWLYIVITSGEYNAVDGTPNSDIQATKYTAQDYKMFYSKTIQMYAVLPYDLNDKNILQADLSDEIHNVITPAIQKVLGRVELLAPFSQKTYEGFTLVEDALIEEIEKGSYAIYGWVLKTKVEISNKDVYSYDGDAPLKAVDLTFDNGLKSENRFN